MSYLDEVAVLQRPVVVVGAVDMALVVVVEAGKALPAGIVDEDGPA